MITKQSRKRFIEHIKFYAMQYELRYNSMIHHTISINGLNTLTIKKKYPKIKSLLLTIIIKDLCNVIMSYVDDVIEINYKLIMVKDVALSRHYIIFESNDNNIWLENYKFKFYFVIITSYNDVKYELHVNKYINNIFRCQTNIDWLPHAMDMDKYFITDISQVFNTFMHYCYGKLNYLNHESVENISCIIDNNTCTLIYDTEHIQIKVFDQKKMRRMIHIVKCITSLFKKYIDKYVIQK